MPSQRPLPVRTLLSLCVFAQATAAPAAPVSTDETLAPITVTARKRETALQDTPVAMTVLDGQIIQTRQAGDLAELSILVPGLHVGEALSGDQLFLRGAGSGVNQGFEQSVGSFIDGVSLGRGRLARMAFLDLDRVEVLKGPQGPLFGRNTVAGALSLSSAEPGSTPESTLHVDWMPQRHGGAVQTTISGPLGDQGLRARLAVRSADSEGYVSNPLYPYAEPAPHDLATRLTLLHETGEHKIVARWFSGRFDTNGREAQLARCAGAAILLAPPDDCRFDDRRVSAASSDLFDREREVLGVQIGSLNWRSELQGMTLTAITGRVAYDSRILYDSDNMALNLIPVNLIEHYAQWSQELRLASRDAGRLEWMTGLYAQTAELDTRYDISLDLRPLGSVASTRNSGTLQHATTYAAFGELGYRLAPDWRASLALRYTREHKSASKSQFISTLFGKTPTSDPVLLGIWAGAGILPHQLDQARSESDLSPEFTLAWQPDPQKLAYFRAVRGYKTGGFDHAFSAGPSRAADFQFDGESATLAELGFKTRYPEQRLELNLALHHTLYRNLQVSTYNGIDFTVGNAAQATANGVEADFHWRAGDAWQLSGNVAWLLSQYDHYANASCYFGQTASQGCIGGEQDLSGRPTQFSPHWSSVLSLAHRRPLADGLDLAASLDWLFRSRQAIANNLDPFLFQPAYSKFDLRLALNGPDHPWEIALLVKNLADKRTFNWGNQLPLPSLFGGSYFKFVEPPRTFVLQLSCWL